MEKSSASQHPRALDLPKVTSGTRSISRRVPIRKSRRSEPPTPPTSGGLLTCPTRSGRLRAAYNFWGVNAIPLRVPPPKTLTPPTPLSIALPTDRERGGAPKKAGLRWLRVLAVLPLLPVGGRAMGEGGRGDEGALGGSRPSDTPSRPKPENQRPAPQRRPEEEDDPPQELPAAEEGHDARLEHQVLERRQHDRPPAGAGVQPSPTHQPRGRKGDGVHVRMAGEGGHREQPGPA